MASPDKFWPKIAGFWQKITGFAAQPVPHRCLKRAMVRPRMPHRRNRKPQMKKYLLAAVAALALGGAANAETWWTLSNSDGACAPATSTFHATRDSYFANPFTLAAEMRAQGRSNGPIQMKRTVHGTAYAVPYDGMISMYFVSKTGCRDFLAFAQGQSGSGWPRCWRIDTDGGCADDIGCQERRTQRTRHAARRAEASRGPLVPKAVAGSRT